MFYRDLLMDLSDVTSVFGAYLGICLDAVYLGGTPQNINVSNSKVKASGRFIVAVFIWFIPYNAIKLFCGKHMFEAHQMNTELILLSMMNFIGTVLLFSFAKLLFNKLRLLRR